MAAPDLSLIPETKQEPWTPEKRDETAKTLLADGAMIMPKPLAIDAILVDRGEQYGKFEGQALLTQALKECVQTHIAQRGVVTDSTPAYQLMRPDQREALDMICHKIGRIVNGNPDYIDSWDDIAGYAKLVADRLRGVSK